MPLFTLANAGLAYGDLPLLDRAAFAMEAGERIGLIGRNGTGKSSLLAVIAGETALDDGELKRIDGLKIVRVGQEPEVPAEFTVEPHKLEKYQHLFSVGPSPTSGGERKRAVLAHAFAEEPGLLLLDEPTNHLDIEGILVLEGLILRQQSSIVITHDRAFLDRVCTRIVELDRGVLRSYEGNYSRYEELKALELASEAVTQRKFDKFWAQEEAWIRKGVEARRTRNEGRVRRLERLRGERAARRARTGNVRLSVDSGQRSGKLVCELSRISKSFEGRAIVKDLDLIISRGDRLGIVGRNGAGKTTIMKLILGTLAPDSGLVRLGTNVQPAYFDQMREALDPEKTVAETIEGSQTFVIGHLAKFLFPPRRLQSPVRMLSGGERNRLLLARLFAKPANVLVLDEPTNDLDIESLELLEAALQDYDGTLLLVSHDRAFLDNVVTQTLAANGDGTWKEYVGGWTDYLRQRPSQKEDFSEKKTSSVREKGRAKLSYKETRELESLPKEIEALEAEQLALATKMSTPEYFRQAPNALRADQQRNGEIEKLLSEKLERWTSLESRATGTAP